MAKVTDTDKGYRALMAKLRRLDGGRSKLSVGILGSAASQTHEDASITIGELGEIFEFGLGQPQRSWLRGYVDENTETIQAKIRRVAAAAVGGTLTLEAGLNLLGLDLVGGIVQRIQTHDQGEPWGVTPETQRRKGPDKTTALINSGQFIGSISHEVEDA